MTKQLPMPALVAITIFTVVGFAATVMIVVLFNHLTGIELHSLTLLFVIPMGGLLVGAAAASGMFVGYLEYHKPISKNQYLLGAVLGVFAFLGVYYVSYITTYVTSDNEINYSFKGDPISSYEIGGQPITFSKFLEIGKQAKSQFLFRGVPVGGGVDTGGTVGSFLFYLQLLAAATAGAAVGLAIVGDKKYCEKCKKYTEEDDLFKFDVDQYDRVVQELTGAAESPAALQKIIKTTTLKDPKVNAFAQVVLQYCSNCYDNRLIIKVMKSNSKSGFEEVTKLRQNFSITAEVAKVIIEKA